MVVAFLAVMPVPGDRRRVSVGCCDSCRPSGRCVGSHCHGGCRRGWLFWVGSPRL